jgi:hypothetical protein
VEPGLERPFVAELRAALGAEHAATARVHDELAAAETLERGAAKQRDELLVERAVKSDETH